jgi:glycosyltransferase involved in cell wall biosynthesis
MQKIYFFLKLAEPLDLLEVNLKVGNPGLGGTEYTTICLAHELSHLDNFQVYLVSEVEIKIGGQIKVLKSNLIDLIDEVENNAGVLVFRPTRIFDTLLLGKIKESNVSIVAWAHVTPLQETLRILHKLPQVKKVIALGERQYLGWVDNPVIAKTRIIRNGHYIPRKEPMKKVEGNYIAYVGSLVPQKGFHLLAKLWPIIVKDLPELRLKVIGSGNLYDSTTRLGKYGIAKEDYENQIFRYLGDSSDSVDFLGKLSGKEKNEVVGNAILGIINPSGETENCPLSALDFQSLGVPVISAKKYGVIDTVENSQTGILYNDIQELPSLIYDLTTSPEKRAFLSGNCVKYVESKFNFKSIVSEWDKTFREILLKERVGVSFSETRSILEFTTLLSGNIRYHLPFFYHLPTFGELRVKVARFNGFLKSADR